MTKFFIASHGVIRRDNKILVTRRSQVNDYKPGLWDFPGGKLNPGEKAEEGLHREIKEETGLEVQASTIDYVFTNLEELPKVQYFLLVYECEYQGGEIMLNPEEHDDYNWVTIDELSKMEAIHFVKEWLEHRK